MCPQVLLRKVIGHDASPRQLMSDVGRHVGPSAIHVLIKPARTLGKTRCV